MTFFSFARYNFQYYKLHIVHVKLGVIYIHLLLFSKSKGIPIFLIVQHLLLQCIFDDILSCYINKKSLHKLLPVEPVCTSKLANNFNSALSPAPFSLLRWLTSLTSLCSGSSPITVPVMLSLMRVALQLHVEQEEQRNQVLSFPPPFSV